MRWWKMEILGLNHPVNDEEDPDRHYQDLVVDEIEINRLKKEGEEHMLQSIEHQSSARKRLLLQLIQVKLHQSRLESVEDLHQSLNLNLRKSTDLSPPLKMVLFLRQDADQSVSLPQDVVLQPLLLNKLR
jgi:hypothetical protein